jgi:hypothetical protein
MFSFCCAKIKIIQLNKITLAEIIFFEGTYNGKITKCLNQKIKRVSVLTETLCGICGSYRSRTCDPLLVRQML